MTKDTAAELVDQWGHATFVINSTTTASWLAVWDGDWWVPATGEMTWPTARALLAEVEAAQGDGE